MAATAPVIRAASSTQVFKYIDPSGTGPIVFLGRDGVEAEEFIHAVRQRAFNSGKGRDNDWIVDFAAMCFLDKALRWHIELDDDIKSNWVELQKAVMNHWPHVTTGKVDDLVAAAPPKTQWVPSASVLKQVSTQHPTQTIVLFLKHPSTGRMQTKVVDPKATTIQSLLHAFNGIPGSLVRLTYRGKELTRSSMTLEDYGITETDSTISASLRAQGSLSPIQATRSTFQTSVLFPPSPKVELRQPLGVTAPPQVTPAAQPNTGQIQLFLKHPTTGKTQTIMVNPSTTSVRKIQASFDEIPASFVRLTYQGKALSNPDKNLAEYGISTPHGTIVASTRMSSAAHTYLPDDQ